ncbi:MAG: hypothetical protein ACYCOR_20090 [Acidobacteriaceae bacterium]
MKVAQKIVQGIAGTTVLLAVWAATCPSQRALAQDPDNIVRASTGPILAASGENLLLCAANNLPAPAVLPTTATIAPADKTSPPFYVTLKILNGVTGAVLSQTELALPPLGSTEEPPDPCLTFTVAPSTFAPSTNLFVARVELNPQPLPPGLCRPSTLTVSMQIFTPDTNGNPTNIRAISFEPPDPCLH